jgi:3-keto-5-aminohexanoate cleavage enzyme
MKKLVITITCDSTISYPRNPYNPQGIEALAEEYVRSVNVGAAICHLHGPYNLDEKIRPDGTKLSDLDFPGWQRLRDLGHEIASPIEACKITGLSQPHIAANA